MFLKEKNKIRGSVMKPYNIPKERNRRKNKRITFDNPLLKTISTICVFFVGVGGV